MAAMDIQSMRSLFDVGVLQEAIIAPAPMEAGSWILLVQKFDGTLEHMTVARSKRQKIYKSLDSAVADVTRVGFKSMKLSVAMLNVA